MSTIEKFSLISHDDYLVGELRSKIRHEYVAGQIFAMVGATREHNVIAGNVFAALHAQLHGRPCQAFMSDMKVKLEKADAYYYPDVIVSCETSPRYATFLKEPVLVVEVLSATTESIDRREKRLAYQSIPSLQEYVLIAQDKRQVEVLRREAAGCWQLETFKEAETVVLQATASELPMQLIYENAI